MKNLPPGRITLAARGAAVPGIALPATSTKILSLAAGQELQSVEVIVRTSGRITGRVLDQNDQPVPDANVVLVAREYQQGELRYIFSAITRADDEGKYSIAAVAGRSYLLMGTRPPGTVSPMSDAPLDPKLRRPSVIPTFYPGVENVAEAQVLTVGSGEERDNIDLRLHRGPSLCVEGSLTVGGSSGVLSFDYLEASPHSGTSGNGGLYTSGYSGRTADDGKIRACNLHPGTWRFTVRQSGSGPLGGAIAFNTAVVDLSDRDKTFTLTAMPVTPVDMVWTWDSTPIENFVQPPNWIIAPQPITRAPNPGELPTGPLPKADTPLRLNLFADDYYLRIDGVPAGTYIKSILYGQADLRRVPLRPGSQVGDAQLRVVLAHDGGTLRVLATDRDGNPLGDHFATLIPATATAQAALAETGMSGQTDQNGTWTSPMIAPGKYFVAIRRTPFDRSPETLQVLLRARTKMKEVDIPSNSNASVVIAGALD